MKAYNEKYEPAVIIVMSLAIILSLVAVTLMIKNYTPTCNASKYTYCEQEVKAEH